MTNPCGQTSFLTSQTLNIFRLVGKLVKGIGHGLTFLSRDVVFKFRLLIIVFNLMV